MLKELTSFTAFSQVLGQRVPVAFQDGQLILNDLTVDKALEVLELLAQVEPTVAGVEAPSSAEQVLRVPEAGPVLQELRDKATGKKRGRRAVVDYEAAVADVTLKPPSSPVLVPVEPTPMVATDDPDVIASIDAHLAQEAATEAPTQVDAAEAEALAAADAYLAAQKGTPTPADPDPFEGVNYNWVEYNSASEAKQAETAAQTVALTKAMERAAGIESQVPAVIPDKVLTTSKMLDVLYWLHDQGVAPEAMYDVCVQLQDKVPALKRAGGDLQKRVDRTVKLLEVEA